MMGKRLKSLLIWIALFLAAGLIYHFRMFLLVNVIEPMALVIWTFWKLVCSLDQRACWGGVIVLFVMVTLRLIPSSEAQLQKPAYTYEARSQSQFDYWQGLIENGDHNCLRNDLKALLLKVIAKSNDFQVLESDEVNISFTTLSVETQEYLLTITGRKRGVFQGSTCHSLKTFLSGLFQGLSRKTTKKEIDMINEVILWMENELDISYEK